MIPKIIHYVWVGGNPKPPIVLKCIKSWEQFCPGWEIREWGDEFLLKVGNCYARSAYDHGKYAFVADWLRLYVLKEFGGFYLDTDMEMLKPIETFCQNRLAMGLVNRHGKVFFNGGFIGCEPGDVIIADLLAEYDNADFVLPNGELNQKTNVVRMAEYFAREWKLQPQCADLEIDLGDGRMFYPHDYFLSRTGYTYHHYCASWLDDWFRKSWLSIGRYKVVRFKRRKDSCADNPRLLKGERALFCISWGSRKRIMVVKRPSRSEENV